VQPDRKAEHVQQDSTGVRATNLTYTYTSSLGHCAGSWTALPGRNKDLGDVKVSTLTGAWAVQVYASVRSHYSLYTNSVQKIKKKKDP
jgi:hypothetical protein